MAKKMNPVVAPVAAAKPKVVEAAPAAAVEKSEVKGSGRACKAAPRVVSSEEIRQRAYAIFARRGYAAGNPQEDWYEAERQLRAGL